MPQSATPEGLLDGEPEEVAQIRSWIRGASTPYRLRLADDLEDLEQDILVGLTVALRDGAFDGRSSFKTYVRSFSVHKCIDRIRFLSRRHWVDVDDLELKDETPSAFEKMSRQDVREMARQVVAGMSEECRELWTMLRAGLKYKEMAERTGVAAGTLRVRVLRCRQKATELREQISRNELASRSTK